MVKQVIQTTLPSFGALPCTTSLHEMAEQRDQVNDVTPNLLTKEETTDSVCFVSTLTLKVSTKKGSQNPIFVFWVNAHVEGIHT